MGSFDISFDIYLTRILYNVVNITSEQSTHDKRFKFNTHPICCSSAGYRPCARGYCPGANVLGEGVMSGGWGGGNV